MRKNFKYLILVLLLSIILVIPNVKAGTGYTYDHNGKPIYSTVGLVNNQEPYTFNTLGIASEDFTDPSDLFLYTDKETGEEIFYLSDTKSNKVFVFNEELRLVETLSSFRIYYEDFVTEVGGVKTPNPNLLKVKTKGNILIDPESENDETKVSGYNLDEFKTLGSLEIFTSSISGVYRAPTNKKNQDLIYISDKVNNQVLILEVKKTLENVNEYKVVQIVTTPEDVFFTGSYNELGEQTSKPAVFDPTKMVTDSKGRMYIICESVYQGIVQLGADGKFNRLAGVNYTTLSFWDAFWRMFSTETQLSNSNAILNTIFTSIAIDDMGFIYITSDAYSTAEGIYNDTNMIKRLNPSGNDVLRRNGYSMPMGDVYYVKSTETNKASKFRGIAVNSYGVYTVVDKEKGRLFTYDYEGNLLYISGGSGTQMNAINNPAAIIYQGENLFVLDKTNKTIVVFEPSDIAKEINLAIKYHEDGDKEKSAEQWEKVKTLNSNYEYAYVGIGKLQYENGQYKEAMENFKIGFELDYYSKSYKAYRDAIIEKNFGWGMMVILVLIGAKIGFSINHKIKYKTEEETGIGDE